MLLLPSTQKRLGDALPRSETCSDLRSGFEISIQPKSKTSPRKLRVAAFNFTPVHALYASRIVSSTHAKRAARFAFGPKVRVGADTVTALEASRVRPRFAQKPCGARVRSNGAVTGGDCAHGGKTHCRPLGAATFPPLAKSRSLMRAETNSSALARTGANLPLPTHSRSRSK